MSRFFSRKFKSLTPYVPGEQPKDMRYIKLNTNESPFVLPESARDAAAQAVKALHLYPDPDCTRLRQMLADRCGIREDEILLTNGSDEALNFAFAAFCDESCPAVFPDITYGFYSVFAEINRVPYSVIPLREDLRVDPEDYIGIQKTIFLANPNAPTGLALTVDEIERIVKSNPDHVVVIDEAYVDFGGESALPLIPKYQNLLVVRTFSKSRSMAGARLGFAMGNRELIADLDTIKYSTNPYNVNSLTSAVGIAVLEQDALMQENCRRIMENRAFLLEELKGLGFVCTDSKANFVFAKHAEIGGEELYRRLRQKGILVRHFSGERIRDYNRITVGTRRECELLAAAIREVLEEIR